MIINYCDKYQIENEINALWDLLELPINDNMENGLKLLDQIKEFRRRLLKSFHKSKMRLSGY